MSKFSFTLPNGKTFEIKGPPTLTLEQARAIFDQQVKTGSLVGFKPGDVLSAASQAAAGLESARAQLTSTLQSATDIAGRAGAALDSAIKSTGLTAPIDAADFLKQPTALASIGKMAVSEVTGAVAQAKNLVGQASDAISNIKGVGEFGLDVKQLESAGVLKPGTSALLDKGMALADVIKTPSVYTGKNGIRTATDLLQSPAKQAEIQQQLMASGTAALAAVGIPVRDLSPEKLAGVALTAAKSIPNAEQILKSLPSPADVKTAFDKTVRDAAFAVNLVKDKLPQAFKEEAVPVVAAATVARETVNAATNRILGNAKIPTPNFQPVPVGQFLYQKTADQDLVYSGTDVIVWDRINAERLRRGLPGLADAGFPRPENT